MGKKLITLEKSIATTDSISKFGFGYIELTANGNNPPSVNQNTKFFLENSSGIIRYIIETGNRVFSWGTGSFPSISDGTWYLYAYEAQNFGNIIPDTGVYGASQNVPTYEQTKGGFYNLDGKVISQFTVSGGVVSNIITTIPIQTSNEGNNVFHSLSNFSGLASFNSNTPSTSKDIGAAIVTNGGLGVEENINAGGTIKNIDTTQSTSKDTGAIATEGGLGVKKNIHIGGTIKNDDTTDSTSKDTGAIATEGGLGVKKNIHAGGTIKADGGFGAIFRTSVGGESLTSLITKVIEIGDWDMVANVTKQVLLGSVDFKKIRELHVMIRRDDDLTYLPLVGFSGSTGGVGDSGGGVNSLNATALTLIRVTSGFFDSVNYNSTSFNRGWVYITYEA